MRTFVKTDAAGDLMGEAAALRWLGEATSQGGLRAARVVQASRSRLEEEFVDKSTPTREAARAAGVALAHTHAAGAPWFGAPPPGWDGPGYMIAQTLTPVIAKDDPAASSWGTAYAKRLWAYARPAVSAGSIDAATYDLVGRVCDRLVAGELDHPQPSLVREHGHAVARLHGDLWAGNLLFDSETGEGVLIDPMAHGGHAETDLAMLALFGYPHLDQVIAGYQDVSPLSDGWRDRVCLHQLAPLLHHCLLYGCSYASSTRLALLATLAL